MTQEFQDVIDRAPFVVRCWNGNGYFIVEKPLAAHALPEAFREASAYGRGWAARTTVHDAYTGNELSNPALMDAIMVSAGFGKRAIQNGGN